MLGLLFLITQHEVEAIKLAGFDSQTRVSASQINGQIIEFYITGGAISITALDSGWRQKDGGRGQLPLRFTEIYRFSENIAISHSPPKIKWKRTVFQCLYLAFGKQFYDENLGENGKLKTAS